MTGKILGLLMALCGDDKSCLTLSLVHEPPPTTVKEAAVLVAAVKIRANLLSDSSRPVAQPMFECMIKRQEAEPYEGKCWTEVWDAHKKESK